MSEDQINGIKGVKNAITNVIEKHHPGYRKAIADYAKDSAPTNAHDIAVSLGDVAGHRRNTAGVPFLEQADVVEALKADKNAELRLPSV